MLAARIPDPVLATALLHLIYAETDFVRDILGCAACSNSIRRSLEPITPLCVRDTLGLALIDVVDRCHGEKFISDSDYVNAFV